MAEVIHDTAWLSSGKADGWLNDFLNDFCVTNFSFHNFHDFYQDMIRRVIALNCAAHTGRYSLTANNEGQQETKEKTAIYKDSNETINRMVMLQELEHLRNTFNHIQNPPQCPLSGVKQTASMSANDPKRKSGTPFCCDAQRSSML